MRVLIEMTTPADERSILIDDLDEYLQGQEDNRVMANEAMSLRRRLDILRNVAGQDASIDVGRRVSGQSADCNSVPAAPVARNVRELLFWIYETLGWHTDDDADETNASPEDATAHINGLVRQRINDFRYRSPIVPYVDRGEAVNLAQYIMDDSNRLSTKAEISLARAVLVMDEALTNLTKRTP